MNTTELKKLAEAAIYNDTEALPHALTVFHNTANPAAILELLEALKKAQGVPDVSDNLLYIRQAIQKIRQHGGNNLLCNDALCELEKLIQALASASAPPALASAVVQQETYSLHAFEHEVSSTDGGKSVHTLDSCGRAYQC